MFRALWSSSAKNMEKIASANMCHGGDPVSVLCPHLAHRSCTRIYSRITWCSLRWKWYDEEGREESNRLSSRFWKIWVLQILGFFSPKNPERSGHLTLPKIQSTVVNRVWSSAFSKISIIGALWTLAFSGVQRAPCIQILGIQILGLSWGMEWPWLLFWSEK